MGDVPPDGSIGPGHLPTDLSLDGTQVSATTQLSSAQHSSIPPRSGGNQPLYSQFSSAPSLQPRTDPHRTLSHYGHPPYSVQPGQQQQQQQTGTSFNMGAMSGALPDYGPDMSGSQVQAGQQPQPHRRLSGASTPAVVYQLQQNLQYPPAGGAGGFSNPGAYGGFGQSQYQSGYGQQQHSSQQTSFAPHASSQTRLNTVQHQPTQYPQVPPQYFYFPGGYSGHTPQSPYGSQFPGSFVRGGQTGAGVMSPPGLVSGFGDISGASSSGSYPGTQRQGPESTLSPVPRGPPRKPKQSGHALWVGNLPPGATILDLKDHFSRDATRDIESLFLISKSNCAFVNYRTEAACAAAMQRFHDSRFQGVRLVCRLRRSSTPSLGVPTGPSAMSARRPSQSSSAPKSPALEGKEPEEEGAQVEKAIEPVPDVAEVTTTDQRVPEKFFIIKSLTLQDLEQSVRNGIWATQSHNEEVLNRAYESADNVYLVFSANKSGEYFGYARMASPILEGAAAEIYRAIPRPESTVEPSNAPRTIPTPATGTAPRGRVIDDSARGTIFWEAELTDEEDEEAGSGEDPAEVGVEADPSPKASGKPFKVEWLSTTRLPFYRTRGLRNPWNANREVKIARDGTELETSVGKRLVQMFHRMGPPAAGIGMAPGPSQMQMPPFGGGMPGQGLPQQFYHN